MSSGKLIAISGVTGSQGGAATRHLMARGWRVRGLTFDRAFEGARKAAAGGVELIAGDMGDPATLDRLMDVSFGKCGFDSPLRHAHLAVACGRFMIASLLLVLTLGQGAAADAAGTPQQPVTTATLRRDVLALTRAHIELGVPGARQQAQVVRTHISDFVVEQLQAAPALSARELQARLQEALCFDPADRDACIGAPTVLATGWGPRATERQVVVAYALSLGFMGGDSSVTVIENYVWRPGSVTRTSAGGRELDGYFVQFEEVTSRTGQYWLLAWGTRTRSSGRGLGGRAAVYRVEMFAVEVTWLRTLCNVNAQRNAIGWEVSYADCARLCANHPEPLVLDIYKLDPEHKTHSGVVRYRY